MRIVKTVRSRGVSRSRVLSVAGGLVALINSSVASAGPLGILLAANEKQGTLSVIDPSRGTLVARIPEEGIAGHEVAASPDGRFAFVPIYGDGNAGTPGTDGQEVVKIDLSSRRVVGRYRFDHGVRPHAAVYNPVDGLLYVTTELDNSISIIDPEKMTLVESIPTGHTLSHMLVISPDGLFGYVANIKPGGISVLDLKRRTLLGVIPVSAKLQRIALSYNGRQIFTNDQTSPRVAVIDTATRKITQWIQLPAVGMGVTATPDGRWLVVAIEPTSEIAIVDLKTMTVAKRVSLPQYPHETVISPDGKMAYVSCSVTGQVMTIRTADWTVVKQVMSGPFVDGLAWTQANTAK